MADNDMHPDPWMNELPYNWFSGLLPEQRDILLRIAEEEEERRSRVRKPAAEWLHQVLGSEATLLERTNYLGIAAPALGDFPDLERTLAYALVSDTLTSDEFVAYTTAVGYHYW